MGSDPDISDELFPDEGDSTTTVAYNWGGGLKIARNEHVGLRGDVRYINGSDLAPDHWADLRRPDVPPISADRQKRESVDRRRYDGKRPLDPNAVSRIRAITHDERSDTEMSKSNVNPNHYKVAGRERQGEDIPQARNKRKHAESLARRRTKVGEGRPPSAREGGAASTPGRAPARMAKAAARKARATPLQTPPGQKRGHNLVPGRSAPHARFPKAARRAAVGPTGAAPKVNAKQATKRASVNLQGADKRGKRSTAQKRAPLRHEFDPMPSTNAIGPFRKRSPRSLPMRK